MAKGTSATRMREWLAEGDLRSDGLAREVARLVAGNPFMLADLLEALFNGDGVVRGHAADAVERISRGQAQLLGPSLGAFVSQAKSDPVPMVRWHLAMILGNLAADREHMPICTRGLLGLLRDRSPFVKSWAISGLCQIGRGFPARRARILSAIAPLANDPSIAVRHRAAMAVSLLMDPELGMPSSWVKRKG